MDNNKANQMNPNNDAYWKSKGLSERPAGWLDMVAGIISLASTLTKAANDNKSNQMNPNNDEYYNSRGETKP